MVLITECHDFHKHSQSPLTSAEARSGKLAWMFRNAEQVVQNNRVQILVQKLTMQTIILYVYISSRKSLAFAQMYETFF